MQIALVQLPFPSQADPDAALAHYYELYNAMFVSIVPEYKICHGDLWEAPLWIAHMDGAIDRPDTQFIDLSRERFDADICTARICEKVISGEITVLFSPLAQNFDLACSVSDALRKRGHRTAVGGNMAGLAPHQTFSFIYDGIARAGIYAEITKDHAQAVVNPPRHGRRQDALGYRPNYRHLRDFGGRVPLLRINASHGCLYDCSFCGDAWSRQLHVVDRDDLMYEFDELSRMFPDTKLIYVGDKTFGQSKESVRNLIEASKQFPGYRYIVQTHVKTLSDELLDDMRELGVAIVEMGFESGDVALLKSMKKGSSITRYQDAINSINKSGMHVTLNVLGGLPNETALSYETTRGFIDDTSGSVSLYNLYNFVPYPKTPIFNSIKARIYDWNFANWREDRPVVFQPYHLSVEESWQNFQNIISLCTAMVSKKVERLDRTAGRS